MAINQRLLKINRDFLLGKHKEAEDIFNKERFNEDDIKKLVYHYEVAADYAKEFFPSHIVKDEVYLKEKLKKTMWETRWNGGATTNRLPTNAKFIFDRTLKKIEEIQNKKKKD